MSDIAAWPHYPSVRGPIYSGADPANPDGWQDNLDLIKTTVNSKQDKPAVAGTNGQVLSLSGGSPVWADNDRNPGRSYLIYGEIKVPSGASDYILPFDIPTLGTGETATLVGVICYLYSGTSATVKIARKPWGGAEADLAAPYNSIVVTTTEQEVTSSVTLASKDRLRPIVTAVSGTPTHMTFTFHIRYTR